MRRSTRRLLELKNWGAEVVITAATPKFAAQSIRKIAELGWKPLHFMTNVSISVGSVITPAGQENATGLISAAYLKDPTDQTWKDDPGMNQWRAFMAKYMPGADLTDAGPVFGYGVTYSLWQVLKQCGTDFSRANIMKQAANLKDLEVPVLLPGIKVNTSPTNFHPIRQMQLQKWDGNILEVVRVGAVGRRGYIVAPRSVSGRRAIVRCEGGTVVANVTRSS